MEEPNLAQIAHNVIYDPNSTFNCSSKGPPKAFRGISDLLPGIYVLIMVNLSDEFPCLISNELL